MGLKFAIRGLFLGEILVRTFLGVDTKQNPGLSFLCQTIVSVKFTKERWTQKLSGILLNYYYYSSFFNWTFLGLRSGPLDFFWVRV